MCVRQPVWLSRTDRYKTVLLLCHTMINYLRWYKLLVVGLADTHRDVGGLYDSQPSLKAVLLLAGPTTEKKKF